MTELDARIGHDRKAGLPGPLTKRIIFTEVREVSIGLIKNREEVRDDFLSLVTAAAHWKRFSQGLVDFRPNQSEAHRTPPNLTEATLGTNRYPFGPRQELASKVMLARLVHIKACHERQVVIAKLLHVVRIEYHIGIDPQRFLVATLQSLRGQP